MVWIGSGKAACLLLHPGLELSGGTCRGVGVGSRVGSHLALHHPTLKYFEIALYLGVFWPVPKWWLSSPGILRLCMV